MDTNRKTNARNQRSVNEVPEKNRKQKPERQNKKQNIQTKFANVTNQKTEIVWSCLTNMEWQISQQIVGKKEDPE